MPDRWQDMDGAVKQEVARYRWQGRRLYLTLFLTRVYPLQPLCILLTRNTFLCPSRYLFDILQLWSLHQRHLWICLVAAAHVLLAVSSQKKSNLKIVSSGRKKKESRRLSNGEPRFQGSSTLFPDQAEAALCRSRGTDQAFNASSTEVYDSHYRFCIPAVDVWAWLSTISSCDIDELMIVYTESIA